MNMTNNLHRSRFSISFMLPLLCLAVDGQTCVQGSQNHITMHLIFFIRDATLEETSLKSLIFWTDLYSLFSNFYLLPDKFRVVTE